MLHSIFQAIAGELFSILILLFQWIVMVLLGEIRKNFAWWNIRIGFFLCLICILGSVTIRFLELPQGRSMGLQGNLGMIANGLYYLGIVLFLSGLIIHPGTFGRKSKDII